MSKEKLGITPKINISDLLAMIKNCKTEEQVESIAQKIQELMQGIAHYQFDLLNDETSIQGGNPYIRFKLVRYFSDSYAYEITPVFEDGTLTILGRLNHFKDGLGCDSKDWDILEGWDDEVPYYPEDKIDNIVAKGINLMLLAHQKLIEGVGVPLEVAKKTAQDSWKGPLLQAS